jgi:hypothetical protein
VADVAAGRSVYATYIKEQLDAQEARKASLETRGVSVITTSGVLVTLLFGLSALTTKAQGFVLPQRSQDFLVAALASFAASGVLAILTNLPLQYEGVTVAALRTAVKERWDDDAAEAERMTSLTRLKQLHTAKKKNNLKSWLLTGAMSLQVLAVIAVAAAVWSLF